MTLQRANQMGVLGVMLWIVRTVLIILFMSHFAVPQVPEESKQQEKKSDKPKFAAIPVPNYNKSTGFGLGAIVTLLYPMSSEDEISPPSSTTLFGFYASNKTNVFGAAQKFHLKEDKCRFTLALARASINFQYYAENIGGEFIDFNTGSKFGLLKGELELLSDFYLGLKYRYMKGRTKFDIPIEYDPPENTYSGLGPTVAYDTRDNVFNAYTGYFITLETLVNHSAFGSDRNYSLFELKANRYLALKESQRLALRLFLKVGAGDVPFEDQAVIGLTDLRGYSSGKYRADQKYTIQGEYRWTFYKKFGMVAFAGIGWVADRMSEIRLEDTLPSVGVGLRYMMIPQYRINIGVDFAVGKDDTAFYFRINEAF